MINRWLKISPELDEMVIVAGICPLLGAVTNFQAGLATAILFTLAFVSLGLVVSAGRHLLSLQIRLIVVVSVSATVVTVLHLMMQAFFYEQSLLLGIYGYLIAVCALVMVFSREVWGTIPAITSFKRTLKMSLLITVMLLIIGAAREYIQLQLLKEPAGAFITLALFLSLIKWLDACQDIRKSSL